MRTPRATRLPVSAVAVALTATSIGLLAWPAAPALAAPLMTPVELVSPTAFVFPRDVSADGRFVLATGMGTPVRLDRRAGSTTDVLGAGSGASMAEDGTVVGVAVAESGAVTFQRVDPTGVVTETAVGSLPATGLWYLQGRVDVDADGTTVAFSATDTLGPRQVVAVADLTSRTTVLADTTDATGMMPSSRLPSISADGRSVSFITNNAGTGCTNGPGCGGLHVRDLVTGGVALESRAVGGAPSIGVVSAARLSANGRFLVFVSDAGDLVANASSRMPRLYVRDRWTGLTRLVPGTPRDALLGPSVSDDGRLVAYTGSGKTTYNGVTYEGGDAAFVADLSDGSLRQVGLRPDGGFPNGLTREPVLTAAGDEVLFAGNATDLVPNGPADFHAYAVRLGGPGSAGADVTGSPSRFVPLVPQRLLDTRRGLGAPARKPAGQTAVSLQVVGRAGIPAGATAVALNVTATQATKAGFVTVHPSGVARPLASNLNLERTGQTIANLVVVPIGSNGRVELFTQYGTHLVADALGYFVPSGPAAGGRYAALSPRRLLDTRSGAGVPAPGRIGGQGVVKLSVLGREGVPASGVAAVVLNVTATEAERPGFVTVYPGTAARPEASSLNVDRAGDTVPNLVIVPVGADGTISIFTQQTTHLVVDVAGYFTDNSAAPSASGLFVPFTPNRIVDTRGPFPAGLSPGGRAIYRPLLPPAPRSGVSAVLLNVTATETTGSGFVTIHPGDAGPPVVSNLNVTHAGHTVPNAAIATLGADTIGAYTSVGTHLVIDAAGYFMA